MFPKSFPILTTSRLTLNQFTLDDAPTVQSYITNSPDIAKNTLRVSYPYSFEEAKSWINSHVKKFDSTSQIIWAVRLKDDPTLIGAALITLSESYPHAAEISYWVAKPFRRQGYATEAIKAVTHCAFSQTSLHRLDAGHFASNPHSGKALLSAGFTLEGTLRDYHLKDNQFTSVNIYSILKTDQIS